MINTFCDSKTINLFIEIEVIGIICRNWLTYKEEERCNKGYPPPLLLDQQDENPDPIFENLRPCKAEKSLFDAVFRTPIISHSGTHFALPQQR
jgi:hypothetical protein